MDDNVPMLSSSLRVMPRRKLPGRLAAVVVLLALVAPGPALAHGELLSTKPEKNSTVAKPPGHLIIEFTEAPTKQSLVKVRDGCGDEVVDQLAFEDRKAHVFLTKAQPGKWKVSYDVVSAVDGHPSKGSYALTVEGKADCSSPKGDPKDDSGNGGTGPGPGAAGDPEGSDESSFPVVPVVIGTLALVAVALIVRRLSG